MRIFTPALAIPQKQQAQVEIQGLGTKKYPLTFLSRVVTM